MDKFIVTIDGPSGCGKSTICKLLVQNDDFIHIDTGKIYRAIAYILDNINENSLQTIKINFQIQNNSLVLFHNEIELNEYLTSEEIAKKASNIAKFPFVREFVNTLVRKIATNGKFVIDGRDAGSIIFKNADIKFFLTADIKERALRRSKELGIDYTKTLESLNQRDSQDSIRSIAPLLKPQGAVEVDTTKLSIEEVYKIVKSHF